MHQETLASFCDQRTNKGISVIVCRRLLNGNVILKVTSAYEPNKYSRNVRQIIILIVQKRLRVFFTIFQTSRVLSQKIELTAPIKSDLTFLCVIRALLRTRKVKWCAESGNFFDQQFWWKFFWFLCTLLPVRYILENSNFGLFWTIRARKYAGILISSLKKVLQKEVH